WKLMALIIPAAWTSISYAYDWNDDVSNRINDLVIKAASEYQNHDYESYKADTEMAVDLFTTIEPQPQSSEEMKNRRTQGELEINKAVKETIAALAQRQADTERQYQDQLNKSQSMSKEDSENAMKAAEEKALAAKEAAEKKAAAAAMKANAAREKAEATSDVDEMLGEPGSGKNTPKTNTDSGGSMAEISAYTAQVSGLIRSKFPAWDTYKGKQCSVVIHTGPDGTLLGTDSYSGDNDLCNYLKEGLRTIDKFPRAPNQSVYSIIKDAPIDFRP
ncbi:cell envelope integrity protein TolA, partial [Salmonella enterica]|nr:cell envelope integrity protein TolA [Salmonella enterica]